MSRKLIGDAAMTAAERQQRRRDKLHALGDAAQNSIQSAPTRATCAGRPGNSGYADYPRMLCHPDGCTAVEGMRAQHDRLTPDGWEMIPRAVYLQRPVWHHGVLGANNTPFVATIREVLA